MGSKIHLQMVPGLQYDDSTDDFFFSLYEGVKATCIQGKLHFELLSFPGCGPTPSWGWAVSHSSQAASW